MTKLKILKLAMSIHPCPTFEGDRINIQIKESYHIYNSFDLIYASGNTAKDFIGGPVYYHIRDYINIICVFVNINENNIFAMNEY